MAADDSVARRRISPAARIPLAIRSASGTAAIESKHSTKKACCHSESVPQQSAQSAHSAQPVPPMQPHLNPSHSHAPSLSSSGVASTTTTTTTTSSMLTTSFWSHVPSWRTAALNTSRCLVFCSLGDLSALFYMQSQHIESSPLVMAVSMAAGLLTSFGAETILLKRNQSVSSWSQAANLAAGMSLISMLVMEAAMNIVDVHLTGGHVHLDRPEWWLSVAVALGAGFVAPLPYTYARLRKLGKSCH
ncbi:hypothetical protein CAOG_007574 [Capsaspora owczarzaki ATCC 30864]|uniref:DUF4396 domain-containing protein n=1 Tax=Capsaspora owczarzaki (strain ATCC 30864) TaxID=595528 RepID=A0A0D2X532_CAPO3|nr:hypothetical protein CAOG_007574 [Capsaspora owczarzaki ATCC 30864]